MTTVDLDAKARTIRAKLGALHRLSRRTADMAVEIGGDLIACKRAAKRAGEDWLPWLAKHRFSVATVERLMALAKWAKSNPREFCKLKNCLPVTLLYRVARYGVDEVEDLLRRLDSGELKSGKKPPTTIDLTSGLSRSKKSKKPKQEQEPQEPKQEQEPAPAQQPQSEQPLQLAAEPTNDGDRRHAAAAEPQAAPPMGGDAAAAFLAALTDLLRDHPPPDNVRALAAAYRDQARLHVNDIVDFVDLLTRLIRQLRDEATPPEGRPH